MTTAKRKIEVGSTVRLKKSVALSKVRRETATVVRFLTDIKGGVMLSGNLEGFCFWNVADLEMVP